MFERFNPFAKKEHAGSEEPQGSVVREVATPQEAPEGASPEKRFESIKTGIEAIVDELGIPSEDILGRDTLYTQKLLERGVLKEKDLAFVGMPDTIKDAVAQVARERFMTEETQRKTGARTPKATSKSPAETWTLDASA